MNDCLGQHLHLQQLLAVNTHFMPDGNPAPPLPRKPEALISEIIYAILSITMPLTYSPSGSIPSRGPLELSL